MSAGQKEIPFTAVGMSTQQGFLENTMDSPQKAIEIPYEPANHS